MADLERVHAGQPDRPVIVFIHGLGGQMFDTWVGPGTSADDCWPHWVGQDTECDTWVLGYDAAISRWQDQAMSLIDQGVHLAHRLATHEGTSERDLVLIGHSMGELLIKKMIVQGMTLDDPTARAVAQRVRGVVFVATPHQGSELASLVQALSRLTRPNPQMEALRRDDGALLELNRQFRIQRTALAIAVQAFAERRDVEWKTNGWIPWSRKLVRVRVVSDSSSDPGLDGVTAIPLPEDHFSICKPGRRDSRVHASVRRFVEQLIQQGRPSALNGQPAVTPAPMQAAELPMPSNKLPESPASKTASPAYPPGRLGASLDLTAQALAQRDVAALPLWTACALFHGGVDDETLAELEERGGWGTARPWLVRHHVLTRNMDGRWNMLPPLSRHALDAAVMQQGGFDWNASRGPMSVMFAKRVAAANASHSSNDSLAARRWLMGRFDTLARLMQRDMDSPTPDDAWLRAMAEGLGNLFQFNAVVAKPLVSSLNVRFGEDGDRLRWLAELESRLGEVGQARAV